MEGSNLHSFECTVCKGEGLAVNGQSDASGGRQEYTCNMIGVNVQVWIRVHVLIQK